MYKKSIFAYYGFLMFHRYTCPSYTCEFLKDSTLYCEGKLLSIIILPMISNSQNSSCTDLNLVDVWRLVLNFCQLLSYLITLLVFIQNSEFCGFYMLISYLLSSAKQCSLYSHQLFLPIVRQNWMSHFFPWPGCRSEGFLS